MIININDINEGDLRVHFEDTADHFPVLAEMTMDGECKFMSPIITQARVFRVANLIEIEGNVETTVRLACGRCLNEYDVLLSNRYRLTYTKELPESLIDPDQSDIELTAEEMGLILFKGESIDIRDALQEQIVMAIPQRPLCSPSCKGLCPTCGKDLNEGDCGCRKESFGTLYDALKDFKVEKK